MEKDVKLKTFDMSFSFHIHEPIRQKEFEEYAVKKLVVDSFPEPFRNQFAP